MSGETASALNHAVTVPSHPSFAHPGAARGSEGWSARWLICLSFLALLGACAGDADEFFGRRQSLPDTGPDLPRVSLKLPDGVTLTEAAIGPTARRYDFALDGRPILGLYLGSDPRFDPPDDTPEVQHEFVGGLVAKTVVMRAGDGWSRDMLVLSRYPVYYYFFYRGLRGADLAAADHIIGSLREQ